MKLMKGKAAEWLNDFFCQFLAMGRLEMCIHYTWKEL